MGLYRVNILFTPGPDFENLRSKAEFNLVTSRAVQAASLKAIKEGEDTIDLAALKKENATVPNEPNPETPVEPNEPTEPDNGEDDGDDDGGLAG